MKGNWLPLFGLLGTGVVLALLSATGIPDCRPGEVMVRGAYWGLVCVQGHR